MPFTTAPSNRKATGGQLGWVGAKPIGYPTIDWTHPYMQSVDTDYSTIWWIPGGNQSLASKELITNTTPSTDLGTDTTFDGEPCRYYNNPENTNPFTAYSSLTAHTVAPPSNGDFTMIAMIGIPSLNVGTDVYSHFFCDGNMWDAATNFAFCGRFRETPTGPAGLYCYVNNNALSAPHEILIGTQQSPLISFSRMYIVGMVADNSGGHLVRLTRPSPDSLNITTNDNSLSATWPGGAGETVIYGGSSANTNSTGRGWMGYIGFVYFLGGFVASSSQLDHLVANPYQIFT